MTIVYDVSHIRQRRAGIGRFAALLLRALIAADAQRSYILHAWAPDLDRRTIESFSGPNVRLNLASVPGALKRLYWNILPAPKLERFIGAFDLFHSSEALLPPLGVRRSVATFYDAAFHKFPQFYGGWTARKWEYLFRRSVRKADAVIVISESTRNDLIEMTGISSRKVHIVRPPVDPIFNESASSEQKDRVRRKYSLPDEFFLFVGTLEPRKNVVRLVKAFEMFHQKHRTDVSLVLVGGKGWLYEDTLAAIETSPLRSRILLLDYVEDADLSVLYQTAMMFVFPSLYEGHGFPVAEAMASGVPVITSNNSSLKEIGENAALLVDPENVNDLSRAMESLFTSKDLRDELSAKGRQRAMQFSLANAAHVVLHLYDTLG